MFNNINIDDVLALGMESNEVGYPKATSEQLQELFIVEALSYMAQRPLPVPAVDQQTFNRDIAKLLAGAPDKCPARMLDLLKSAISKVKVANESNDNSQFIAAQTGLEMLLSFMNQLAGACVRSAFYTFERALASEDKALDLIRQSNSGFSYAGPRVAVVLPETAREAIDTIVKYFDALHKAGISGTSQWFRERNGLLQLGGKREDEEWVNFYTIDEVWMDIKTQRTQRMAEQAAARSAAFGTFASLIHGLEAADKHGKISDAAEPVVITKPGRGGKRKPAEPSATIQ